MENHLTRIGRFISACVLILALLLVLTGCADTHPDRNAPPVAKAAYEHGCNSGYRAAGLAYAPAQRDWSAYQTDPLYRMSWDEGYQTCHGRYLHQPGILYRRG